MTRDVINRQIDYEAAFRHVPAGVVLLSLDFEILDANDEFLDSTGRSLGQLAGRSFFEAFPDNPGDPHDTGPLVMRRALAEAVESGQSERTSLMRYDVEDPGRSGVFEQRYFSVTSTPIFGRDGKLAMIEFSGHDVTPIISQIRAREAAQG